MKSSRGRLRSREEDGPIIGEGERDRRDIFANKFDSLVATLKVKLGGIKVVTVFRESANEVR